MHFVLSRARPMYYLAKSYSHSNLPRSAAYALAKADEVVKRQKEKATGTKCVSPGMYAPSR